MTNIDKKTQQPVISPVKRGSLFFRVFIFFLLLLLAAASYMARETYIFLTIPAEKEGREIIFSIAPGATFDRVAWDLKKAGAINNVDKFRLLARYEKALGAVKAGDFSINTGWTPPQVLFQITKGQANLQRLSLREGLTWWETAKQVEEQGFATYADFEAVIHDPVFLRAHGISLKNAEGFLFPDTYLLPRARVLDKAQAEKIASLLIRTFWKKNISVWKRLPKCERPAPAGFGLAVADIGGNIFPPLPSLGRLANAPSTARSGSGTGIDEEINTRVKNTGEQNLSTAQNATSTTPVFMGSTDLDGKTGSNSTIFLNSTNGVAQVLSSEDIVDVFSNSTAINETGSTVIVTSSTDETVYNATALSNVDINGLEKNAEKKQSLDNATSVSKARTEPLAKDILAIPADVSPKALRYLVTLASLVERETGVPVERPRVAGVYANRLRIGMLLQCDPTIIYGEGLTFSGSIRRSQIQNASNRYNTYQHVGLPPGPISSMGVDSLLAAFLPEKHDYLYFVATGKDNGHTFSKTLEEHNRAVKVYRSRVR